jgi:hypothetical protein
VEILGSHILVVATSMVFSVIIPLVDFSGDPLDNELGLFNKVAYPVVPHVNGARALLFYGIIGKTVGGGVVGDDQRWGLGMVHIMEGAADDGSFLAVDEECAVFGFGGGGGDMA